MIPPGAVVSIKRSANIEGWHIGNSPLCAARTGDVGVVKTAGERIIITWFRSGQTTGGWAEDYIEIVEDAYADDA